MQKGARMVLYPFSTLSIGDEFRVMGCDPNAIQNTGYTWGNIYVADSTFIKISRSSYQATETSWVKTTRQDFDELVLVPEDAD